MGTCALCVEDDDDVFNDSGYVDTSSGGVSIDDVIVVSKDDVFANDKG